jgi:hypothetical protein
VPHVPHIKEHGLYQLHSSEQQICGPTVNTLIAPRIECVDSGVGVREWCRHPGQHSPRGSKMGGKSIF